MSDELNEDMKEKIRQKYREIQEKDTIEKAASELGISEASFHKYKNSKSDIEETSPEKDIKDFNEDFKEDENEEDEDEEDESFELVF